MIIVQINYFAWCQLLFFSEHFTRFISTSPSVSVASGQELTHKGCFAAYFLTTIQPFPTLFHYSVNFPPYSTIFHHFPPSSHFPPYSTIQSIFHHFPPSNHFPPYSTIFHHSVIFHHITPYSQFLEFPPCSTQSDPTKAKKRS